MTTSSRSPQPQILREDILTAHIALQEWATRHGGRLDEHIHFARDEQRGVHIQVKPEWTPGVQHTTCVIKIPLALTMSYFNAIDYRPSTADGKQRNPPIFSNHGVVFPRQFLKTVGPEETTAFFLMGQYLRGSEGFWYPYLRTLPHPDELTTPLYYTEEDLAWLNMTSLAAARERRIHVWRTNYENGSKALKESGFQDADQYIWDLYLWASTIIASRAFTSKVLAGIVPTLELPEDRISVLLPLIDATNHRPLAKVEWQAGTESIGLAVMEDVKAGKEVSNNYGPRNNEQLMMNYGFCIPENICEYRVVSLRAPPGSPLNTIKTRYEQTFPNAKKDKEDKYYVFSVSYPLVDPQSPLELSIFSPDLLHAVSVIVANERELARLEIDSGGFHIPFDSYTGSRNFFAALNQILLELITHIQKLQLSGRDLTSPRNLKQRFAKMYRDSQIQLSQTAILFANWPLGLARRKGGSIIRDRSEKETILDSFLARIPTDAFTPGTTQAIRSKILDRGSILPKDKDGELFQFGELFSLLPGVMQRPGEDCLRMIMSEAKRVILIGVSDDGSSSDDEGNGPHSLLALAIFICSLVAAHRRHPQLLSPRLIRWCNFLLETYPAPSDDVAWALPDEDDEGLLQIFDQLVESLLSDQTFTAVGQFVGDAPPEEEEGVQNWWLSPNWLRWAWMVLEHETIMNMVDDPIRFVSSSAETVELSLRNFLYIPS